MTEEKWEVDIKLGRRDFFFIGSLALHTDAPTKKKGYLHFVDKDTPLPADAAERDRVIENILHGIRAFDETYFFHHPETASTFGGLLQLLDPPIESD